MRSSCAEQTEHRARFDSHGHRRYPRPRRLAREEEQGPPGRLRDAWRHRDFRFNAVTREFTYRDDKGVVKGRAMAVAAYAYYVPDRSGSPSFCRTSLLLRSRLLSTSPAWPCLMKNMRLLDVHELCSWASRASSYGLRRACPDRLFYEFETTDVHVRTLAESRAGSPRQRACAPRAPRPPPSTARKSCSSCRPWVRTSVLSNNSQQEHLLARRRRAEERRSEQRDRKISESKGFRSNLSCFAQLLVLVGGFGVRNSVTARPLITVRTLHHLCYNKTPSLTA